jgi:hypothetical protein
MRELREVVPASEVEYLVSSIESLLLAVRRDLDAGNVTEAQRRLDLAIEALEESR